MSDGPEAKIEKTVSALARSVGWLAYKWSSPGRKAVPDRMYLRNGEVIFIEFKAPGEEPDPLQIYEHRRIRKQGFKVYVIDNYEDGAAIFAE